jgi:hypothetical protein
MSIKEPDKMEVKCTDLCLFVLLDSSDRFQLNQIHSTLCYTNSVLLCVNKYYYVLCTKGAHCELPGCAMWCTATF